MTEITGNLGPLFRRRQQSPRYRVPDGIWVIAMVVAMIGCDLGMFFLGNTRLRLPMRVGTYLGSLALLILIKDRGTGQKHPAARWVPYIVAILAIGVIHPQGGPFAARIAQIALYLAVVAPLVWIGRIRLTRGTFRAVMLMMWAYYTCSALVGALQISFPGAYDGAVSENYDETSLNQNKVTLADGTRIVKPKGLSDNPSGASAAGVYALVLGAGVLLTERRILLRIAAVAGLTSGLFCIYICQERTNLIIVGLGLTATCFLLIRRRAFREASLLAGSCGAVVIVGTLLAFVIGGAQIGDRFSTLVASDPATVYGDNRGFALTSMSDLLASYPVGAGLGRWGMVAGAFGNPDNNIYVEMMWQAFILDGGFPLIVLYGLLLVYLLITAWRVSADQSHAIGCWGAVIFGYTLASVAASFVFAIFATQMGMEAFLINACVFAAASGSSSSESSIKADVRRLRGHPATY